MILFQILITLFCIFHPTDGENWQKFSETPTHIFYIDTLSVEITGKYSGRMWIMRRPTRQHLAEERAEYVKKHGEKWKLYDHTTYLEGVDCYNEKTAILSNIDYDADGYVLKRAETKPSKEEWNYAAPNTTAATLVDLFCWKH